MVLQKNLFDILKDPSTKAKYVSCSKDFSRKSALSFSQVAMTILNGFNNSIDYVLGQQECDFKERQTSSSAFYQQRYKIEPELFKEINEIILQYDSISYDQKRFKRHRIIAGDGTNLLLPHSKEL